MNGEALLARLLDRRSWTRSETLSRFLWIRVTADEARCLATDPHLRRAVERFLAEVRDEADLDGGLVAYVHDEDRRVSAFLHVCLAPGGGTAWRGPVALLRLISAAIPDRAVAARRR